MSLPSLILDKAAHLLRAFARTVHRISHGENLTTPQLGPCVPVPEKELARYLQKLGQNLDRHARR